MPGLVASRFLSKRSMFNAALALAIALPLVAPAVSDAAKRPKGAVKLKASQMKTVGKVRCGKVKGAWYPGTKLAKSYFVTHAQQAKNYKALAKKKKGSAKRKATRQASSYSSKAKSQLSACRRPSTSAPGSTPSPSRALRFSVNEASGLAIRSEAPRSSHKARSAQDGVGGSNLAAVSPSGTVSDAVSSGAVSVKNFMIKPDGNIIVVFDELVNLEDPATPVRRGDPQCIMAEVSRATGVPTCVDSELDQVLWDGGVFPKNRPIQFDADGAIYYLGTRRLAIGGGLETEAPVLRKASGGVVTELVTGDFQPCCRLDFAVAPNGTAIIVGDSSFDGVQTCPGTWPTCPYWVRRVTPDGTVDQISSGSPTGVPRLFPDGNIYFVQSRANIGGDLYMRYLSESNQLDAIAWIADGFYYATHFDTRVVCPAGCSALTEYGKRAFVTTANGEVFGVDGANVGPGVINKLFPVPSVQLPATLVTDISTATAAGNEVLLAGSDSANRETLSLYDPSGGRAEVRLLPADQQVDIVHIYYSARKHQAIFDGVRPSDNQYVVGRVDLSTGVVSMDPLGSGRLRDFQTFD